MDKPFIITYRPKTIDANRELEIVYAETNTKAMFKWLSENENTCNHFSSYSNEPLTNEQVNEFLKDYDSFKREHCKPSPYFK